MKVWLVTRNATWCEDDAIVVVAEDKLHAERRARWSSEDFKKGPLRIKEVKLDTEQCIFKSNVGG